jgi:hypothetical protein
VLVSVRILDRNWYPHTPGSGQGVCGHPYLADGADVCLTEQLATLALPPVMPLVPPRATPTCVAVDAIGGRTRARTWDPLIKSPEDQWLYQWVSRKLCSLSPIEFICDFHAQQTDICRAQKLSMAESKRSKITSSFIASAPILPSRGTAERVVERA